MKGKVLCIMLILGTAVLHGQVISSGRVNSMGKFSFRYGRLDVSVKIPRTANGLWPAIWLLGENFKEAGWPACGEIDMLEMGSCQGIETGRQGRLLSGGAHWGQVEKDGTHPNYTTFKTNTYGLQYGDFHLVTLIRSPRRIRLYLDLDKLPVEQRAAAKPYFEMDITPALEAYFSKPFFVVFNLAVGGDHTGIYDAAAVSALNEDNSNQAVMAIDYIRVYDETGNMIFNDEFNGTRLDTSKWNVEENNNGGGNQELQRYRRQNVSVGKDRASGKNCLIINAKRES